MDSPSRPAPNGNYREGNAGEILRSGAGANAVQWDGRDEGGRAAANGIYFYRIETRDNPMTVKAVLAR